MTTMLVIFDLELRSQIEYNLHTSSCRILPCFSHKIEAQILCANL